jgi:WD40 repeat protein
MPDLSPELMDTPMDTAEDIELTPEKVLFNPETEAKWSVELTDYITCASLSKNNHLLLGLADGRLVCISAEDGHLVLEAKPRSLSIITVTWHANGQYFACADQGGMVSIFSTDKPDTPLSQFKPGKSWTEHLAWHAEKPLIAVTCGKDLGLFDLDGQRVESFSVLPHTITGLAWHPQLPHQLAVSAGNAIYRYETATTTFKRKYAWNGSLISLSWSPDGNTFACGVHDNTLHTWNVRSGNDLQMSGYSERLKSIAWTHDSALLATTGGLDVIIWRFSGKGPEGSEPDIFEAHQAVISAIAFQHHGKALASADQEGYVILSTLERVQKVCKHHAEISTLTWAQDDNLVIATDADGWVKAWPLS